MYTPEPVVYTDAPSWNSSSTDTTTTNPGAGYHPYSAWTDTPPRRSFNWRKPALILALVAVVGLVIFGLWAAFHTTEVQSTLTSVDWNRTIYVAQYQTQQDGGWSVPAGGRQTGYESRQSGTRSVYDHTEHKSRQVVTGSETYVCGHEDEGNGFFADIECTRDTYGTEYYDEDVYRDEPVYSNWYFYDIDRWVVTRTVPTNGTNQTDPAPYWGTTTYQCEGQAIIGCERESSRSESYFVTFTQPDGKTYRREVPFDEWNQYVVGNSYTLVINSMGVQNNPLRPRPDR